MPRIWASAGAAPKHALAARVSARPECSRTRAAGQDGGVGLRRAWKADGPPAGSHTLEAVDFIARRVAHIPDKGQVVQRYYGYQANRTRGERRKAEEASARLRLIGFPPKTSGSVVMRPSRTHLFGAQEVIDVDREPVERPRQETGLQQS